MLPCTILAEIGSASIGYVLRVWASPASLRFTGSWQVGANQSNLVTKTSSLGMWVPVHNEEWDGDIPLSLNRPGRPENDSETGEVVFERGTLPWKTGRYEASFR